MVMHTCNVSVGESPRPAGYMKPPFKQTNKPHYSFEIKSKQRQPVIPSGTACPCGSQNTQKIGTVYGLE